MTYFFVRVVVNTLAAAIVMNVVPGLRLLPFPALSEPFAAIFSYIVIGLIFGVLHAFVRPVILFLTGRLYIWSMGLLALATDTFIFLLLSYLAPTDWQVGGTRLLSAILGAMVMGLVVIALEALTGLGTAHTFWIRATVPSIGAGWECCQQGAVIVSWRICGLSKWWAPSGDMG